MKHNTFAILAAMAAVSVTTFAQEAPAQGAAPGGAAPQGPKPSMFLVGVAKAGVVDHNPVRSFSGRVLSPETVAVVAQVAGEVKEVGFQEGAVLKKGDVMYRIDPVKYEAAAAAAKADVARCEATYDYAKKSFERAKTLFEKKVASDDDLDSATSAYASAEAALAAAKAALISAEDNLAHCTVTAPVDGKVGLNAATVGNYVTTASGALATIVRQDPVRVAFAPGMRDYISVFGGEKGLRELFAVRLRLADGTVYDAEGEVEFVGNAVNAATDTMPVYARFPNKGGILVPGATVKVEIQAKKATRYVALPLTAVQHDGDKAFVWMVGENNMPVRRDVVPAATTDTYEAIASGLEEGEEVIVRGTHKIMPDRAVEPVAL